MKIHENSFYFCVSEPHWCHLADSEKTSKNLQKSLKNHQNSSKTIEQSSKFINNHQHHGTSVQKTPKRVTNELSNTFIGFKIIYILFTPESNAMENFFPPGLFPYIS